MQTWQIYLLHVAILVGLLSVEHIRPQYRYQKLEHSNLLNLGFGVANLALGSVLAFVLAFAQQYAQSSNWGLFHWVRLPLWAELLLAVLLFDLLVGYTLHRLSHKSPWLWQLHLVHHSDRKVNATTGHRHHPLEMVVGIGYTAIVILLLGADYWALLLYSLAMGFLAWWHHSNYLLWPKAEELLRWVVVTPKMHRVHHHERQPYTDANFGGMFSFWDRLFGTYRMLRPEKLVFGLDTHPEEKQHDTIEGLVEMPFSRREKQKA